LTIKRGSIDILLMMGGDGTQLVNTGQRLKIKVSRIYI